MSRLETVRDLFAELSPAERVQAMRWLTGTSPETPGIERTRGVCGGAACLLRTRIPVWVLVRARQLGSSESELLDAVLERLDRRLTIGPGADVAATQVQLQAGQ